MRTSDRVKLGALCAQEPALVVAYLFGSQARGEAGPLSDVDVAVLTEDGLSAEETLALRLRLGEAIGGALRIERVDVVALQDASYLLQHRVLRDGQLLFCRDEAERQRYEQQALRNYLDFRSFEERYLRAVEDRILTEGLGVR